MKRSTVIVGLQWGDEGKGKITDILAKTHDVTVRFNGGNNAGHTVVADGRTFHFSLIPSSALRGKKVLIAQAVVINPKVLLDEITLVKKHTRTLDLGIDPRCHLVMPYHRLLDSASENFKGKKQTGSLRLGIGFTYEDRTNRAGIRMQDLLNPKAMREKLAAVWKLKKSRVSEVYGQPYPLKLRQIVEEYGRYAKRLRPYLFPVAEYVRENLSKQSFLFEAAQGTYLDFVFGSYPYTVAYHTIASSALPDVGLPPVALSVVGVMKAYTTRVGNGPFPTDQHNPVGDRLRSRGNEFGTVSGRPRRCGWLDLVLVKHAVNLNGAGSVVLNKLDVLSGLPRLKIATGYTLRGKQLRTPPLSDADFSQVKPNYITLPGWQKDITGVQKFKELPKPTKDYIRFIEKYLAVPIQYFSIGPDRRQTVRMF
jgi:adenylosuccinate synthase